METKYCQGKSKDKQDATEFMAFIGIVGVGVSLLMYFIFIMLVSSCQAPEKVEPLRTPSVVRTYTVQVQPNGVTIFPKFIPILNGK